MWLKSCFVSIALSFLMRILQAFASQPSWTAVILINSCFVVTVRPTQQTNASLSFKKYLVFLSDCFPDSLHVLTDCRFTDLSELWLLLALNVVKECKRQGRWVHFQERICYQSEHEGSLLLAAGIFLFLMSALFQGQSQITGCWSRQWNELIKSDTVSFWHI